MKIRQVLDMSAEYIRTEFLLATGNREARYKDLSSIYDRLTREDIFDTRIPEAIIGLSVEQFLDLQRFLWMKSWNEKEQEDNNSGRYLCLWRPVESCLMESIGFLKFTQEYVPAMCEMMKTLPIDDVIYGIAVSEHTLHRERTKSMFFMDMYQHYLVCDAPEFAQKLKDRSYEICTERVSAVTDAPASLREEFQQKLDGIYNNPQHIGPIMVEIGSRSLDSLGDTFMKMMSQALESRRKDGDIISNFFDDDDEDEEDTKPEGITLQ